MPFQRDGVRALLDNHRLLLADDMGLGKTIQAIAALRILRARREVKSCLVTAPASILDQWRREIAKWAPELSAIIIRGSTSDRSWQWAADRDVTLVSYDTLRSDFSGNTRSPVRRKTWDVVVADEAQRIKNRKRYQPYAEGTAKDALLGADRHSHRESRGRVGLDTGVRRPRRFQSAETLPAGCGVAGASPRPSTPTQEGRSPGRPPAQAGNQGGHRTGFQPTRQLRQG